MTVQQVIHLRYNDLVALNEELTRLFGEGNYAVEVCYHKAFFKIWEGSANSTVLSSLRWVRSF
jgi:hypothetical protein